MAYFPFFIDLEGKKGLLVGGGPVALRKAETLLAYGADLTAVSPEFIQGFELLPGIALLRRPFSEELLEGAFFTVAASDDPALNARVAGLCRARGILVNAADDRDSCTFLFPALVREGPLSVGISTSGSSPSAAVWVKDRLAELLPPGFGSMLEELEELRPRVKAAIPSQRRREAVFKTLFSARLERGRPLDEEEIQALITGEP